MIVSSSRKAYLDKPFSITIPNGYIKEVDIIGDFNPYKLKAHCTTSTNCFPPKVNPVCEIDGGYKFKIDFSGPYYILSNTYEFIFFDVDEFDIESVEDKTESKPFSLSFPSIDISGVSEKAKGIPGKAVKKIFSSLLIALAFALLIGVDIRWNESKITNIFGDFYKKYGVMALGKRLNNWFSETESKIEEYSLTNKHPFYESEEFKEIQESLRDDNINDDLKSYIWYNGDGLFVFKKLFRLTDQKLPHMTTLEKAKDFCGEIKGHVPTAEDLEKALHGPLSRITDIAHHIKDERGHAEWTRDEIDGDYHAIFMKGESIIPVNAKNINGRVAGDENDSFAAFRCVLYHSDFE